MVNELTPLFFSTATRKLHRLRQLVEHLSRNGDDEELWEKLGDDLEFLNAEARQLPFPEFNGIVDAMLVLPRALREGRFRVSPAHLRFLFLLLDYLDALAGPDTRDEAVLLMPLDRIKEIVFSIDAREAFLLKGLSLDERRKAVAAESSVRTEVEPTSEEEIVPIALSRLDSLVGKFDAMIVRQFQLKKYLDLIQSLEESARGLDERAGPIVEDLRRLAQGFQDDMTSLDRGAFLFQEELAQFRMLPFQFVGEGWEDLRAACRRKADLDLPASPTLLDRTLLRQVQAPLRELVRNALAHGIEPAQTRMAGGKPERGTIRVRCRSDGSAIRIDVEDDGRGIDEEGIRAAAQAVFPMEKDALASLPSSQLFGYLFEPGVATPPLDGEIVSGEGLGLEGVKKSLDLLQGRIQVTSSPGRGCNFSLQFPASISLVRGFFLLAGGEKFFVSSVFVKEIVVFQRSELIQLPNGQGFRLRDLVVPVFPLSSALEGKESPRKPVEQMIVAELLGETFGLLVDAIVRHAALAYKSLPDALSELKEVQGVVYDEKFNLVPILHIPAVLKHLRRLRSIEFRDRYSPERLDLKNILVVDDSQASREVVIKIFQDARLRAEGASDGIDALEILRNRHFHLVVTDETMPRMDGRTFVENLRKLPEYLSIPVIALVGAKTPESQAQWEARGVPVLLSKSDFSRQDLLDLATRLLGAGY